MNLNQLKEEIAALEARTQQAEQTEPQKDSSDELNMHPPITPKERAQYSEYAALCKEEPWPVSKFVDRIRRWGHLLDLEKSLPKSAREFGQ